MFFIQDLEESNSSIAGFKFEFDNEVQQLGRIVEGQLRTKAENRLDKLTNDYRDLIKASIALEQPLQKEYAHLYQASVIVYGRLDKISVVVRDVTPDSALEAALKAVERQVYERRARGNHKAQAKDWFNYYTARL